MRRLVAPLLAALGLTASVAGAPQTGDPLAPPAAGVDRFEHGRVYDVQARPVALAEVEARVSGSGPDAAPVARARTDGTGMFALRLRGLAARSIEIVVQAENRATSRIVLDPRSRPSAAPLKVTLLDAGPFEGRAVDLDGNPIPGAVVAAELDYVQHRWSATATADSAGEFRFPAAPFGLLHLSAAAERAAPAWIESVHRPGGERVELRLPRDGGRQVDVELVGDLGERRTRFDIEVTRNVLPRLRPRVRLPEETPGLHARGTGTHRMACLPADATFRIEPIAPGFSFRPAFRNVPAGSEPIRLRFRGVPTTDNDREQPLRVFVRRDGLRVGPEIPFLLTRTHPDRTEVVLTDRDGQLTVPAPVRVGERLGLEAVSGSLCIGELREREGDVIGLPTQPTPDGLPAPLYRPIQWIACPARADLAVDLRPACRIAGRFVDATGAPIRDAEIALHWGTRTVNGAATITNWRIAALQTTRTDAQGRFEFVGLSACGGTFRVAAGAGVNSQSEPLSLEEHAVYDEIELVRTRSVELVGRVLDEAGGPAAGMPVHVFCWQGLTATWLLETVTDRDGYYRFPAVEPAPDLRIHPLRGRYPFPAGGDGPLELGEMDSERRDLRLGSPPQANR